MTREDTGEDVDASHQGTRLADISRLGRIFGKVVAPTTLLTGLLFYFGWSFTYWFFRYFGVNSTMLGSTSQDYLMRSVDALFVPVTVAAVAGLVILWARAVIPRHLSEAAWARVERQRVPVSVGLGLALIGVAAAAVVSEAASDRLFLIAPLSLVFGVLLLSYAVHSIRVARGTPRHTEGVDVQALTEWAAVFALVGIGLFWAVSDYAAGVGRLRAEQTERELHKEPHAVLYSERALDLTGPGVSEVRCSGADAAYQFRYDGLVLVLQSGGQYLLLPRQWRWGTGPAAVVPEGGSIRLEFTWSAPPEGSGRC
ncbi:MAG TPA: hypothetical protein VFZ64_05225 [Nocardioidaceae bacterium]